MSRNHSESPNSSTLLKSDALSGVTPAVLRRIADKLMMRGSGPEQEAAAILRALADAIEQSEAKP